MEVGLDKPTCFKLALWKLNRGIIDLWVLCTRRFNESMGRGISLRIKTGEFDPGSEQTLAACLTHASRTRKGPSGPE